MKKSANVFAAAVLVLATLGTTHAAVLLDQQQNLHAYLSQGTDASQGGSGQSFQQTGSNIAGAGFYLASSSSSDTVTISLWTDAPTVGGASQLASVATFVAANTPDGWLDVFWNPIVLTPNTTYFLNIATPLNLIAVGGNPDVYAGGADWQYGNFLGADLTFRTYTDTGGTAPEPGILFLLGLAGIAAIGRHRNA